jgi:hypothetical protein
MVALEPKSAILREGGKERIPSIQVSGAPGAIVIHMSAKLVIAYFDSLCWLSSNDMSQAGSIGQRAPKFEHLDLCDSKNVAFIGDAKRPLYD